MQLKTIGRIENAASLALIGVVVLWNFDLGKYWFPIKVSIAAAFILAVIYEPIIGLLQLLGKLGNKLDRIGLVFLALAVAPQLLAKDSRAPLPEKLLTAKTVYIDNQGGYQEAADGCYSALVAWKRYAVVSDAKEADLIFVIGSGHRYEPGTGIILNGVVDEGSERSLTSLTITDAAGKILWSDTQSAPRGSRIGHLIKEFRERVESEAKQSRAATPHQKEASAQSAKVDSVSQ